MIKTYYWMILPLTQVLLLVMLLSAAECMRIGTHRAKLCFIFYRIGAQHHATLAPELKSHTNLIEKLVSRYQRKVRKHYLHNRPKARHRRSARKPAKTAFGNRSIQYPLGVFGRQRLGGSVRTTAKVGHFLTKNNAENALIPSPRYVEIIDRVSHLLHPEPTGGR